MLINILVLLILCAVVFFIAKFEKENIREWLLSGQTELKHEVKVMYLFWREVVKNPIRIVALIAILVCQRNVYGMLFTILIMMGISYYLARSGLLLHINWKNDENSRMLTYGFAILGVFWLVDSLSLYSIAVIVAVLAVVGGIIYLAAKGELKGFKISKERTSEELDEDYDEESSELEEGDDLNDEEKPDEVPEDDEEIPGEDEEEHPKLTPKNKRTARNKE